MSDPKTLQSDQNELPEWLRAPQNMVGRHALYREPGLGWLLVDIIAFRLDIARFEARLQVVDSPTGRLRPGQVFKIGAVRAEVAQTEFGLMSANVPYWMHFDAETVARAKDAFERLSSQKSSTQERVSTIAELVRDASRRSADELD